MPLARPLAAALAVLTAAACAREPVTAAAPGSLAPAPTPTPPDRSAFVAAVDALAQQALADGPIAGLSIAVFAQGAPVLAKGYGFADLEAGTPATATTSYPIASVSKHFTAALVLRLADQGRLGLDDPLSRFLPDARPKIGALSLRHLLDHTSGLTRGGPAPRSAAQSVVVRGGTARPPGETWDYSNYNYSLVGLALERVTGRDYAGYVHDELAAPLGLTGTGYCEDGTAVPGRARDYLSGRRRVTPTTYWADAHFFAAGGLCSTVLDLVRWEQALEEGRVVSPAMLQAMRAPTALPDGLLADYGLGTRLGSTDGHRKLGHTGGGQGNKAVLARYPDDDVTIAVLTNTERSHAEVTANDLEERIARLLFAAGRGDPPMVASGPSLPTVALAGTYRDGVRLVSIADRAGALGFRSGPHERKEAELQPGPGGTFVDAEEPSITLRFQGAPGGPVLGYSRYRNGWFVGAAVRTDAPPAASR